MTDRGELFLTSEQRAEIDRRIGKWEAPSVSIPGLPDLLTAPAENWLPHQSQLQPADNKFHRGNGEDAKHYWLTPPDLYDELDAEFHFDFDPCPFPLPAGFDGLTCEWGQSNYVNPPFGSIIHEGKKKGPTAWVRKAIEEWQKGKTVVLVYPIDKWVLMLMKAILGEHAQVRNLGDVRWLATEDGSQGKGTGRHIACFVLRFPVPRGDRNE